MEDQAKRSPLPELGQPTAGRVNANDYLSFMYLLEICFASVELKVLEKTLSAVNFPIGTLLVFVNVVLSSSF